MAVAGLCQCERRLALFEAPYRVGLTVIQHLSNETELVLGKSKSAIDPGSRRRALGQKPLRGTGRHGVSGALGLRRDCGSIRCRDDGADRRAPWPPRLAMADRRGAA